MSSIRGNQKIRCGIQTLGAVFLFGTASLVHAQDNVCDPGETPDVIVGDIHETYRWGEVGSITGFSIGTFSCNEGSCWLNWDNLTDEHPVIGQNMFRLKDGRLEHIGQSWLKHGFNALSQELCSTGCIPTTGEHLGVNCADPYRAFTNGRQDGMGPKFEIDPSTGAHAHPVTDGSLTGDDIFKRLQVHDADLDPALNPGAQYFVEAQYVAADDAAAGMRHNNASYRPIDVTETGGLYDIALTGMTEREKPAIFAWAASDTGVQQVIVDVPGDGRFIVAAKATDLGGGTWNYEYAVQNLNSYRAARTFSVPIPYQEPLSNVGFHDVDYHSGDPTQGTDWIGQVGSTEVSWATDTWIVPDANAIRWGTLYNFRFDVDAPPVTGEATLGLWQPGSPSGVTFRIVAPRLCDDDLVCEPNEDCGNCLGDCPDTGVNGDGDALGRCLDCDDGDPDAWGAPGEVLDLRVDAAGTLDWTPPLDLGGTGVDYEVVRSTDPADFVTSITCIPDPIPGDTTVVDAGTPIAGGAFHYLVRATNDCPFGAGTLGNGTFGPRAGTTCP